MECTHYERMGELPHFNPDLDGEGAEVPHEVAVLRELVERAGALVISTPEYAHGLPGSFKNALDWLVSFPPFAGKPTVVLHVARGSAWALDSLREILRTMSAKLIEEASVSLPLGTNQMDEAAILARADLRELLARSVEMLVGANS
jgi:NAD(P)H-dependent FMN reductase